MTDVEAIVRTEGARRRRQSTSERIIIAAERLFGSHGIEGVSMRQIIIEAGASNNSAVAYHFGDRYSLVRAIWERRLPELEQTRAALLERMIAAGRSEDPRAVAEVLLLPSYNLIDADGRHRYAAFLRQALRWQKGRLVREEAMARTPSSARALAMFQNLFPHVETETLMFRTRVASCLFFDLTVDRDNDRAAGLPVAVEDAFLDEAFRMIIACCAA